MKLILLLLIAFLLSGCSKPDSWCSTCINYVTNSAEKFCSEDQNQVDNWAHEKVNKGKIVKQTVICQKVKQ